MAILTVHIYTMLQRVQTSGMCKPALDTVHYIEPFNLVEMSGVIVTISGFLNSVAILH